MTQTFILEEFRLEVPDKWKEYPSTEPGTLLLQSEVDRASLVVTTQLIETPLEKAQGAADANIRARIEAHKTHYPKLQLIEASIAVHSSGAALEMFYSVAAPAEAVLMYIGFLTPPKGTERASNLWARYKGRCGAISADSAGLPTQDSVARSRPQPDLHCAP